MAVLNTKRKATLGARAAKTTLNHPRVLRAGAAGVAPASRLGLKAAQPLVKHGARKRAKRASDVARTVGQSLVTYAPQAAYGLGLAEPPKPKRTGPRVAIGVLIGGSAVYFLDPDLGRQRRQKVGDLLG